MHPLVTFNNKNDKSSLAFKKSSLASNKRQERESTEKVSKKKEGTGTTGNGSPDPLTDRQTHKLADR